MRICRDEDCPACGWPETYVEGETAPERIGCSKCGWVEELPTSAVMPFVEDDGGRAAAGFRGEAGDCVTRAIAIATRRPYREVYDDLALRNTRARGGPRTARNGIPPKVTRAYMADHGWEWTPTMQIGSGCTTHLRADELPCGRIVVRLSKHLAAVIDGVLHDTHDSSRDGTRCVYGYWSAS